jgi:3-deoxy-D-manno-octulosonic-acid transferase
MTFPVYTWAYRLAFPPAAVVYSAKGLKSGKYAWNLRDRLAWNLPQPPPKTRPRVWVHALSLGEVNAAAELIKALGPDHDVFLSTTTRSGADRAGELFPALPRFSLPFDLPGAIKRRIAWAAPDLFVLVETDVWPNILATLGRDRVPALLVNARVSPRSLAGYRRLGRFWGRVLNHFTTIGAQTPEDRDRLLELGADAGRVRVTGGLKFDRPLPETGDGVRRAILDDAQLADGRWLVCGSVHSGEEAVLLDIYGRLAEKRPDLRLLLAPRDAGRGSELLKMARNRGFAAASRTRPDPLRQARVFVLDTLGELDRFYELAAIAFVGKSLPVGGEGGGQNLLEPAARAKPVVFGPRMHNFPRIAALMKDGGGGAQVQTAAELEAVLADLLADETRRLDMGQKARRTVEAHRGALGRTLGLIQGALNPTREATG